jgi:ankyrin repeat protein
LTSEATTTRLVTSHYARGKPCYRAPEFLRETDNGYNNKADIWSLGCIAYELFTSRKPFRDDFAVIDYARVKKTQQDFCKDLNRVPKFYVQELLRVDPKDRPSARILFHQKFRFEGPVVPNKRRRTGTAPSETDIDSYSVFILEWAFSRQVFEMIIALLDVVLDVTKTCLEWLSSKSDIEGLKLMLRDGIPYSHISLQSAAWEGELDFVKWLVEEKKVDVDAMITSDGATALHKAAEYGNAEVVKTLLDAEADVDVQDSYGYTPLIYATLNGHTEIVKMLVDVKADVDVQDSCGNTALIHATINDSIETVKMLLDAKPNVDMQNKKGDTALIWAVWSGRIDMQVIKMLVDAKANIDIEDKDGFSAWKYALRSGRSDILKVLDIKETRTRLFPVPDRNRHE